MSVFPASTRGVIALFVTLALLAACSPAAQESAFQATLPPTQANAPIYTATPTLTPTLTLTATQTPTPTFTLTPTYTPSATPTATLTPTITPSPTLTPSLTPTVPLLTLTPVTMGMMPPAIPVSTAVFSPAEGWSCEDFPCEDDIAGFLQRIQVPPGFSLSYVGQFPGQPVQITYGPDGRLYATVLENGTRNGAVYALNPDGSTQRYSGDFISPMGLAFQPGTDVLYVSGRVTPTQGGGLWRVPPGGGAPEAVITDLPCCWSLIDNQPNGMVFGPDGYLYLGVGALTDHAESPNPQHQPFADVLPNEAAVLRIQPHTGAFEVYASGIRNPADVAFTADGRLFATDDGIVAGEGDRLLALQPGGNYGWPYWRSRGCEDCPVTRPLLDIQPDFVTFAANSTPRGLVAYTGSQFPANFWDTLFVVLWNGTPEGQRVVWIDPHDTRLGREDYTPPPFVTGLIRPADVTLAPDGALIIADFIYGHVWRVAYSGG
ncbi:MAG: PQQ-dependent sugar dehydrogenase [Anaerolineaceae bacterium]|nr:PQQ-dependent sugar dehydrogenase [Anaerolineaceae bacterium]